MSVDVFVEQEESPAMWRKSSNKKRKSGENCIHAKAFLNKAGYTSVPLAVEGLDYRRYKWLSVPTL